MVGRQLFVLALAPALAMAFVGPVMPCRRPTRGVMRMMSDVAEKPKPAVSSYTSPSSPASRSSQSTGSAIVPVNKENIEASAAIVGTGVGVVLLGPILGVILGLVSNYVAKTDNDVGEAARGVGKTALEIFNYLAKINEKYSVSTKLGDASKDVINKIKESDEESVVSKIEETVTTTTSKISDLNSQYDLVGKAKSAVQLAVELSNAAIDKGIELNDKYSLVEKAGDAVKTAASKVKEAVEKA